jgi:hypothetical protein
MSTTTDDPLRVAADIENLEYNKQFLTYSQFITTQYVIKHGKRGILCNWGMGFGKTMLAAAIVTSIIKRTPKRVIFITPSSLLENMRDTFAKYLRIYEHLSEQQIDQYIKDFRFVSSNSSNMFKQVEQSNLDEDEMEYNKKMGGIIDTDLENTCIVIDEAHNLFNAISNGAGNAVKFYDLVMRTKNIRLVFLTGTPMVNHLFELALCFNMLRGYIDQDVTLFPERREEFNQLFVNPNFTIKNKIAFQSRIYGLVSYYGNQYLDRGDGEPVAHFPKEIFKVIKVPMSAKQFSKYSIARIKEKEEASKAGGKVQSGRFGNTRSTSSTYRIRSRQMANVCDPEEIDGSNASELAPKLWQAYLTLLYNMKNNRRLAFMHTGFIEFGIRPIIKILEYFKWKLIKLPGQSSTNPFAATVDHSVELQNKIYGIDEIKEDWVEENDDDEKVKGKKKVRGGMKDKVIYPVEEHSPGDKPLMLSDLDKITGVYGVISGEIPREDRAKLVNIYKSQENKHGGLLDLILLSNSGAEGLSLPRTRSEYLLTCEWNNTKMAQIKQRGIRYRGHDDLPPEEQNVRVYLYLSDYPAGVVDRDEPTTDIYLYGETIKDKKLSYEAERVLMESSVECVVHKKKIDKNIASRISCFACKPSGKPLYTKDIKYDIAHPTCELDEKTKITAKEIIIGDQKFYYTQEKDFSKTQIYEYDPELKVYVPLKPNNPMTLEILSKIAEL